MRAKEYLKDCNKCPDMEKNNHRFFCCWGKKPKRLIRNVVEDYKRPCNLRLK